MKPIIDSLNDVPEPFRTEYEAKDGKYSLKIDGAPVGFVKASELEEANRRVVEFRETNRGLKASNAELTATVAKFSDVDVDALKAQIKELEKGKGKGGDDLKAAVEAAIGPLKAQIEGLKTNEAAAIAASKASARALAIKGLETSLSTVGLKAGVDERAIPDFIQRGLGIFALDEDGSYVAKKGDTPIYSKSRPAEALSIDEWAVSVRDEAPHLFRPSAGGGADTKGKPAAGQRRVVSEADFMKNLEGIAKGEISIV